jgi:hypothetical protein
LPTIYWPATTKFPPLIPTTDSHHWFPPPVTGGLILASAKAIGKGQNPPCFYNNPLPSASNMTVIT